MLKPIVITTPSSLIEMLLFFYAIISGVSVPAQHLPSVQSGHILRVASDTLLEADLAEVSVTSKRRFSDGAERDLYHRYRYYALKVYPYATEAIRIFREVEEQSANMSNRKRRQFLRRKQKELKEEFEAPLKGLSKTQGRILVHMIEKELDTPMYFLIKDLRNGLQAVKWSGMASLYGYHLKKGYIRGEDPIMDMVLDDFDITYTF